MNAYSYIKNIVFVVFLAIAFIFMTENYSIKGQADTIVPISPNSEMIATDGGESYNPSGDIIWQTGSDLQSIYYYDLTIHSSLVYSIKKGTYTIS